MNTKINSHKGFTKIEKLIKNTASQYNLENALNKHKVVKLWGQVASAFVEEAEDQTRALDFKKGVLYIACLSREVASKLRLLAQRIMAALNEVIGRQVVFGIYIET